MRCRSVADCTATAGDTARLESRSTASFRFDAGQNSTLECEQSNCTGVLGPGSSATVTGGTLNVSMGSDGTLSCLSAGSCQAVLGATSRVTCGASSSCTVTVGPASTVTCAGSCVVECLGDCDVTATPCLPNCRTGSLRALDAGVCGCRATVDAGAAVDAGQPVDAGVDAGVRADAGATGDGGLDAGSPGDAGSMADAGPPPDAGGDVDAGLVTDSGVPSDGGAAFDAGVMPDAGFFDADGGSPDAGVVVVAPEPATLSPGQYAVGCQSASTGLLTLGLALLLRRRRDARPNR